jgi:nicotinamide-nucleotide amidase
MPTAEILTIGTELLLGETLDTNTRFIAQTLRGLGVDLYRTQTVGDNTARISTAVREALQRTDIVITTGGLGPTVDDPTRQAIAEAVEAPLEFHPELWEQILARITRYGRTPTENQKRQAFIPKGAIIIENPVGTAPAFIVEVINERGQGAGEKGLSSSPNHLRLGQARVPLPLSPSPLSPSPSSDLHVVITLPGVPREMETLLVDSVVPYLQKRFNLHEVIKVRTLHVSGIGEGALDDQVGDLETLVNPTIGLSAHSGIVDIRIAAKADNATEADGMIATVEKDLLSRLGEAIFGADDETLETVTLNAVERHGWSLATVENGLGAALRTRLIHAHHLAYRGGMEIEVPGETLTSASEKLIQEKNASVSLGLALSKSGAQQVISLLILSPLGREERHLTYGGHPGNATRWAVNTALDVLRRIVKEAK